MDSNGDTLYKIPQFNMMTYAAGHINDGTNEGHAFKMVSYSSLFSSCFQNFIYLSFNHQ